MNAGGVLNTCKSNEALYLIFFEVLLVDGIVLEQGTVVVYGLWRIRQDAGYLGTFGDA